MGAQKIHKSLRCAHQKTLDIEHCTTLARLSSSKHAWEAATKAREDVIAKIDAIESRGRGALSEVDLDDLLRLTDCKRVLERDIEENRSLGNEVDYFLKTGGILFNYYEIIDKGSTSGMPVDHKKSIASKSNSIMKYFAAGDAPLPDAEAAGPDATDSTDASGNDTDATCASTTSGRGAHATVNHLQANDRATLLERYLMHTDKDFIRVEQAPADAEATPCEHCGCTARTVMIHDGYSFCPGCFTVEYVLVDHEKPSYKEPPKEITYFSYKRINHFNEWLNQIQGKETTEIPEEVYDKILLEIKKQKIVNMACLNNAKVRDILKKLKINKYYEHVPHIINRLSGMSMPHIPPELEERLRHMFCQIQVPFLKHSPPSRKNFLSYSYVLHKFMELLEKDQYLPSFPLLKSRDKLLAQDCVWAKICAELGWEFVRSL